MKWYLLEILYETIRCETHTLDSILTKKKKK